MRNKEEFKMEFKVMDVSNSSATIEIVNNNPYNTLEEYSVYVNDILYKECSIETRPYSCSPISIRKKFGNTAIKRKRMKF